MASNSQLLANRVAIVTGGGSGIGRAVCIAFVQEGAKVIVVDVNKESAEETRKLLQDPDCHLAKQLDVSSSDAVQKLFSEIQQFGTPDILVNCAGIVRNAFLVDMTEDMFDDVIAVNLKGTYLMTQAAIKLMMQEKKFDGSIVNISSISAKGGNITQTNYSASKAGVDGFTKAVAKEVGSYGIRCNAIMPGYIETPLTASITEEVKQLCNQQTALGRTGRPEEIANVCVFLASSMSSYMTGALVQASGGLFM